MLCRAGEKAGAQAMAGEALGIKTGTHREFFDGQRDALLRQRRLGHAPAFPHAAEHEARADFGTRQPHLHGLDRADADAAQDRHLLPLPFLVGLAMPDQHAQPVGNFGEVLGLQCQLAAPEGTSKAQGEQRAIPLACQRVGAELEHAGE